MTESGSPGIGTIIAALLIPPLGVWLRRGIGGAFWVSLILTFLGYVPGVLFSLIAIFTPALLPSSRQID